MDNKRQFLPVLAFALIVLGVMFGMDWYAHRQGWEINPPVREADVPEEREVAPADVEAAPDLPPPAVADDATTRPATGELAAVGGDDPAPVTLGRAGDAVRLTVSPVGAGIEEAVLPDYAAEVGDDRRYTFEVPYDADPEATRPLATRSVQLLGETVRLNDLTWRRVRSDDRSAAFAADVVGADGPVLTVLKRFELSGRDDPPAGRGGFEVRVTERYLNRTDAPLAVRSTIQGPTAPPRELEQGIDRQILRGTLGSNGVTYEADQVEAFTADDPERVYANDPERPLMWMGAGSTYFNAIVRPRPVGESTGTVRAPEYVDRFVAERVGSGDDARVATRLVTTEIEVPAAADGRPGAASVPLEVFLGPKDRDLLEAPYYSAADVGYDRTLRSPFGCTWCVFQPVVDVLVALLSLFHFVTRDWGLAIILLVCVVRVALHPITKRAQKNMMRLSKMGPKLEQIKKKYGDDREKMAQAMAEVAPEQTSALLFGCLPMLLQTPIWIALYSTLQATFALRHEPFLYGLTWIDDLAQPDKLIDFGGAVPIVPDGVPLLPPIGITGLNILPFLMGVVFYLNIKYQPQPTTAMSDEQRRQQKMIQIVMVAAFPLFLYGAPSGLNLYILTSTTIGIIETKLIRRNLQAQEEAEEAAAAEAKRTGKPIPKPQPKTAFGRRLETIRGDLTAKVQQAQREAQKRAAQPKKR